MSQRLSVFYSRIISICMFRIPSFGAEVYSLLWDTPTPSDVSPATPQPLQILLVRDVGGSTCSLFSSFPASTAKLIDEFAERSASADHTSPATIGRFEEGRGRVEDMKAMEGGAIESSFQVTPEWLTTVFHTCKIHPILAERGFFGDESEE